MSKEDAEMGHVQARSPAVERIALPGRDGQLALVTMNRPDSMNPLDWDSVLGLGRAFDELAADPEVRVVAVTGEGRAFSAGGDMKKYQQLQASAADFPHFLDDLHRVFEQIGRYAKPYVALVNGITLAGGLELLLSCDLAIAGESARIGDGHLKFGQMGGGGVLSMLPRAVGPARARELILSGRTLTPAEAMAWGLVSEVVPDEDLVPAAVRFASTVAARSPLAVANAKQVLNAGWTDGTGQAQSMRLEREVTARYCLTSNDAREGLAAFAERRRPEFTGT